MTLVIFFLFLNKKSGLCRDVAVLRLQQCEIKSQPHIEFKAVISSSVNRIFPT